MIEDKEFNLSSRKKLQIYPLSDVHVGNPQFNQQFLEYWIKNFKGSKSEKIIYLNGDLIDLAVKRLGNSVYEQELSVNEQMETILDYLKPLKKYIIGSVPGNHECFDEDTELLTNDGWVKYDSIDENILVGTFNKDTRELEYQKPTNINIEYIEDKLIHLEGRSIDTLTTKNHRFYYTNPSDAKTLNYMRMEEIQNIHQKDIVLRQGCMNTNEDYTISDDEIKLIAWCLTDSHYQGNHVIFYQRKSQVDRITNILDSLGIPYKYRERDRDIKEICGKKLKNRPEIGCEVTIERKYVKKLCNSHTVIPDFVSKFSKKQFMVFLEELVFCDGSIHKSSSTSWMLYKSKELLDQVQILCIQNDIRTSLTEYRKGHYRLNIAIKYNRSRIRNNQKIIDYKGIIWCVTVPNDTLIVRRNGKVVITGNSRTRKEFDLDVSKIIASELDCEYAPSLYHKFNINDNEYKIFAQHGNKTSNQVHLMLGQVIRQTQHIDGNLFLYGHCHYCESLSLPDINFNGYNRRNIVLTGSFLDYKGSYAEFMGLKPSPASFPVISVGVADNDKIRTTVKIFNSDEVL